MKAQLYMTHNGLKTVTSMRAELSKAVGDIHWMNSYFHSDSEVIDKYVAMHKDGGNIAFVEEV